MKKMSLSKKLIYFQIIYNCFIKFFIVDFGFPSALNYITDIVTIALVLIVFKKNSYKIRLGKNMCITLAMILFVLGSISALFSLENNPVLYIWSFRNNFRIFLFFYCCKELLNEEDIKRILEMLVKILYVNIILCIFEYFVRGMQYDFLGGLYGNGIEGGNGPLNALMIVVTTYLIIEYINKRKSIRSLLFGISGCLFIATVGEMKIYYFEIIFLIILVCIFVTHNYRMAIFVLMISAIAIIGFNYYIILYPHRRDFLSRSFIQAYTQTYSYGDTEINRLSAIGVIWNNYFDRSIKKLLFGLGMGNGELSSRFSILTSQFYSNYGRWLRYDWFSHSFMFVEFGIVGLALYLLFFLTSGIKALREKHKSDINCFVFIISVFIIVMVFYNQVLRDETFCYTAAFIISIPYVIDKCKRRGEIINREVENGRLDIKYNYSRI